MGKTLSVENNPMAIDEIFTIKIEDLMKLNLSEVKEVNQNSKFLRVWKFFEIQEGKKKIKKISCEAFNFIKAKKEDLLLKPENSFIILLTSTTLTTTTSKNNDIIEENLITPSLHSHLDYNYNQDSEFISNITKRGLEFIFSSDINDEIAEIQDNQEPGTASNKVHDEKISNQNTLSKEKDEQYKYTIYLWNGSKAPEKVKSLALINAHQLSKSLLNKSLLKYLSQSSSSQSSLFELPSNLILEELDVYADDKLPNSLDTKSKSSPNKKKKKDKYKNFKSTFISLNLKEDNSSKLFLPTKEPEKNNILSTLNSNVKLNDLSYYNLFDTCLLNKGLSGKLPKKTNLLSAKKSLRVEKYDNAQDNQNENDDADNEEIDDLENDIIIPQENNNNEQQKIWNYLNEEESTTTQSNNNFSLKNDPIKTEMKLESNLINKPGDSSNKDTRLENTSISNTSNPHITKLNLGEIKLSSSDNSGPFTFMMSANSDNNNNLIKSSQDNKDNNPNCSNQNNSKIKDANSKDSNKAILSLNVFSNNNNLTSNQVKLPGLNIKNIVSSNFIF